MLKIDLLSRSLYWRDNHGLAVELEASRYLVRMLSWRWKFMSYLLEFCQWYLQLLMHVLKLLLCSPTPAV